LILVREVWEKVISGAILVESVNMAINLKTKRPKLTLT